MSVFCVFGRLLKTIISRNEAKTVTVNEEFSKKHLNFFLGAMIIFQF